MNDPVPLCKALVDALLVFETSSLDEMDPDVAVRAMENISSSLQQLDEADRSELIAMLLAIAEQSSDVRYAEFIRTVPGLLGFEA